MSVPSPTGVASAGDERRRLRPYAAYKDSGVEWLGRIPAHWDVRRLKTVGSVYLSNVDKKSYEGQEPVMLCNYTHVYNNEYIASGLDFMPATATSEQLSRFSLRAGDVLITKDSESWTDIAIPALVRSDLPGVLCGYHLALVRPGIDGLGAFLARAFSAIGLRDQFQIAATGVTRFGLSGDAIQTAQFAIPPSDEHLAIAAFLDRETAKIDALIANKERLIELLQEKRTLLITNAVTKGLDSSTPMKEFGPAWPGKLPAHWRALPVKRFVRFTTGWTPPTGQDRLYEGELPWANISDLGQRRIHETRKTISEEAVRLSGLNTSPTGSLLFAFKLSVGAVSIAARDLYTNEAIATFMPNQGLSLDYFYWAAPVFLPRNAIENIYGAKMLSSDRIASAFVVLPPLAEQRAIAAFLDGETATVDRLVAQVREAIERLKEARATLISAAVTGKIDVRDEVAA